MNSKGLIKVTICLLAGIVVLAATPVWAGRVNTDVNDPAGRYGADYGESHSMVPSRGAGLTSPLSVTDQNLTNDATGDWNEATAVSPLDGSIHVVWARDTDDDGWEDAIYHMRSTDGGTTWSAWTVILNAAPGTAMVPSMAIDSYGVVHVVWRSRDPSLPPEDPGYNGDMQLMYSNSSDNGDTWSAPDNIGVWCCANFPRIVVDSNDILYLVWVHDANLIGFMKSTDGGTTWTYKGGREAACGTGWNWIQGCYPTPERHLPDMAVGPDGTIHVTMRATNGDIYYTSSTDGGATWSVGQNIYTAVTPGWDHLATIKVNSEGTIQVVTRDNFSTPRPDGAAGRFLGHLYYLESTDGISWSTPLSIADKTPDYWGGWREEMILDAGDNLYLVYGQYTNTTDLCDVYLMRYYKQSGTWSCGGQRLTATPAWEGSAQIAMEPGCICCGLHVTYTNYDEPDIHYMSLPPPTEVWVDDDYTPDGLNDGHTWGYDAFDNIQCGIDAVSTSTVHVAPGTYYEVLTINKANLTVQSTGGKANPIIDAGGAATVVSINADNVTFSGFTLQNAGGFNVRGIDMAGPISGCNISDIVIQNLTTTGDIYAVLAVQVNASTFSNLAISNLTHGGGGGGGAYGIGLNTSDNNTFTNTTISGFTSDADAQGVLLNNNCDGNSFTNTAISALASTSGYPCGITIWERNSEPSSNDNTFTTTTISDLSGALSVYGIQNRSGSGAGYEHMRNKFNDTHISNLTSTADVVLVVYNENTKDCEFNDTYISGITANVVAIGINNALTFDNTIISGGEIQGFSAPVWSAGANFVASTSNASVQRMTISGANYGIRISGSADASQLSIHYNGIAGNIGYGLRNEHTGTVDASGNWWGDASGPATAKLGSSPTREEVSLAYLTRGRLSETPNGSGTYGGGEAVGMSEATANPSGAGSMAKGTGDALYGSVDYTPWLHNPDQSADPGFQADLSYLHVDESSPQTGTKAYIEEGIDMVIGSTVEVAAGIYAENVSINKSMTLLGQAGAEIVPGSGVGIDISADDVTVQSLVIHNCAQGILVWLDKAEYDANFGYSNLHLLDNTIYDISPGAWGFGIYIGTESERYNSSHGLYDPSLTDLLDFTGLQVRGNEIYNTSGASIVLQSMRSYDSNPLEISENNIHDNAMSAIWIDGAWDLDIEENQLMGNSNGVFFSNYGDGYY